MYAFMFWRDGSNEGSQCMLSCSGETVLMRGHNVCFHDKIRKIIP